MLKLIAAASLGALVALLPVAVEAQTPATSHHQSARRTTGSYSEMRARHNTSRERARAGAEHARKARSQ